MKKTGILALLVALAFTGNSQTPGQYTGTWQGTLTVNGSMKLQIVFHIKADGKGGYVSTADSPDQGAFGLECESTGINADGIQIDMNSLHASYSGKLLNDSTIEGVFKQGAEIPLTLSRTDKPVKKNRPQTPEPPFPYRSEDLQYSNTDQSIRFGATLTIPTGTGPFPAVVMITGSGAQDRDETIFGHKPFAVIADRLTREGYMVLRADDRGVGKSSGNFSAATSADFAADINTHLDYLRSRPETDKTKLGLIGHSEGGMIAPMVAAQRKDLAFIILLAGPGVPITDLMALQNEEVARSGGVSEAACKEIAPLFKQIAAAITKAGDSTSATNSVSLLLDNWTKEKPAAIAAELNLDTAPKRDAYTREMVKEFRSPWFDYFIRFDPAPWLKKVTCKVLALNGDKDIQVVAAQNLPGISAALKKSKSPAYEVQALPGLNHLFQSCKKCSAEEYGELEETMAPAALNAISSWLQKNIR